MDDEWPAGGAYRLGEELEEAFNRIAAAENRRLHLEQQLQVCEPSLARVPKTNIRRHNARASSSKGLSF